MHKGESYSSLKSWLWVAAYSIHGEIEAHKYIDFIIPLIFLKRLNDLFKDKLMIISDSRDIALVCIRSQNLYLQKAIIHHPDSGRTGEVDLSDGKLDEIETEVENSARSILDRNFIPKPVKSKYNACGFRLLCPYKADNYIGRWPPHIQCTPLMTLVSA